MAGLANSTAYGGTIQNIASNNGFVYAGGLTNSTVRKYHESNLVFNSNSVSYGGDIYSVLVNNGFVYVGGDASGAYSNGSVKKYHESNLVLNNTSANYGGFIIGMTLNNGFIYAGGSSNQTIQKFGESNFCSFFINSNRNGSITIHTKCCVVNYNTFFNYTSYNSRKIGFC
jgi:hypothetical protein